MRRVVEVAGTAEGLERTEYVVEVDRDVGHPAFEVRAEEAARAGEIARESLEDAEDVIEVHRYAGVVRVGPCPRRDGCRVGYRRICQFCANRVARSR